MLIISPTKKEEEEMYHHTKFRYLPKCSQSILKKQKELIQEKVKSPPKKRNKSPKSPLSHTRYYEDNVDKINIFNRMWNVGSKKRSKVGRVKSFNQEDLRSRTDLDLQKDQRGKKKTFWKLSIRKKRKKRKKKRSFEERPPMIKSKTVTSMNELRKSFEKESAVERSEMEELPEEYGSVKGFCFPPQIEEKNEIKTPSAPRKHRRKPKINVNFYSPQPPIKNKMVPLGDIRDFRKRNVSLFSLDRKRLNEIEVSPPNMRYDKRIERIRKILNKRRIGMGVGLKFDALARKKISKENYDKFYSYSQKNGNKSKTLFVFSEKKKKC